MEGHRGARAVGHSQRDLGRANMRCMHSGALTWAPAHAWAVPSSAAAARPEAELLRALLPLRGTNRGHGHRHVRAIQSLPVNPQAWAGICGSLP